MKALIVDDSRLARTELRRLLGEHDGIQIVGEAANADEAIEKIESLKPDLIFLDIQMPGRDGFQLLEALDNVPEVIFTTAYDEYALKAFDFNALDYLVKPIKKDRLAAAITKVMDQSKKRGGSGTNEGLLSPEDQVFVKDGDKCWFVTLGNVRLLEVQGNYTTLHFDEVKPMIPRTLNYLESRLDPKFFFRANRQQIVNLKWIERVEPWFSGSLRLTLKGGDHVEVSRRQTIKFKDIMSF